MSIWNPQLRPHQPEGKTKMSSVRELPYPYNAQHSETGSWPAHCRCGKRAEDLWLLLLNCRTTRIPQRLLPILWCGVPGDSPTCHNVVALPQSITQLTQTWTALRSYLISLRDESPWQIRALLKLSEDSAEEDVDDVEVHLLFWNSILLLFDKVVSKLENESAVCVELYSILETFEQKLTHWRDDQFYGYLLQRLLPDANKARADFIVFLNTTISHMDNCSTFQTTGGFSLWPLSLFTMACLPLVILRTEDHW